MVRAPGRASPIRLRVAEVHHSLDCVRGLDLLELCQANQARPFPGSKCQVWTRLSFAKRARSGVHE